MKVFRQILSNIPILIAAACGLLCPQALRAELAGDPTDPGFIRATLLVASPGPAIYQVSGHTFIRMECPSADLDYCFTFENEYAGNFGQLFHEVDGRFMSWPTADYITQFASEGRTIAALPLNLEPLEKQRLWQVLDSLTMSGLHPFNIRKESCSGHILEAIDISLYPASIKAVGSEIIGRENGRVIKFAIEGEGPWRTAIILLSMGNDADIADRLYNHSCPIILCSEWKDYYVVWPDGHSKHLFQAPDIALQPKELKDTDGVTPFSVALIFLLLSLISAVSSLCHKGRRFVRWTAIGFICLITAGWILLTVICASPSALAGWSNLNFLLFNPLPLLLLPRRGNAGWQVILRRILVTVWLSYGIVGPLITFSIPLAAGLFAISAAISLGAYGLMSLHYRAQK